ncbi:MAG: branched-chain amino acid transaminase [Candidatus Nitrosothermus koennekii]|nr:MAG: branched-chain amino acid transaminase [Candidatus Nitrosothermus koennekii]
MQKGSKIWYNGKLLDWDKAYIHVLTHALHYGIGVFEGIRCYQTEQGPAIFRLHEHVKRLFNSAKMYMMNIPYGFDDVIDAIIETVKANDMPDCYIRPIAFTAYGPMGVNPLKNEIDLAIAIWKWNEYIGEEGKGIRCIISSWRRIDPRSMPVQAKATANYANSALARMEALKNGYDEAIMLNIDGMVAESSAENVFIVDNGILKTPPTTAGALSGITRDTIFKIAEVNDLEYQITNITRDDLYAAEEVFLTGTAAGLKPVVEIDNRVVGDGSIGTITKELKRLYEDIVRGRDEKFVKWLTFVK